MEVTSNLTQHAIRCKLLDDLQKNFPNQALHSQQTVAESQKPICTGYPFRISREQHVCTVRSDKVDLVNPSIQPVRTGLRDLPAARQCQKENPFGRTFAGQVPRIRPKRRE